MSATTAPRARPAAVGPAVLVAVALVAVAVVAVHDLAVDQGWTTGPSWLGSVVDDLDGLRATSGVVAAGVVLVALGLLVVLTALKPARRTHVAAPDRPGLWLSPTALGALARQVADRTPGVVRADVERTTRRRVTLGVVTRDDAPTALDDVRAATTAAVGAAGVRVRVKAREAA